jgi:Spy/CpxP family protein refolding chaperone
MSWQRPKLTVLGLVLAVFIAGGAAGAAFDNVLLHDDGDRSERRDHDHDDDDDRDRDNRRRGRSLDDLNLSPDQRIRIDSLLERRRRETKEFWDTQGPRLRAIVDSAEAEVLRALTAEQLVQLDSLRARRRSRSDRR